MPDWRVRSGYSSMSSSTKCTLSSYSCHKARIIMSCARPLYQVVQSSDKLGSSILPRYCEESSMDAGSLAGVACGAGPFVVVSPSTHPPTHLEKARQDGLEDAARAARLGHEHDEDGALAVPAKTTRHPPPISVSLGPAHDPTFNTGQSVQTPLYARFKSMPNRRPQPAKQGQN
jgi:hypothetical protein